MDEKTKENKRKRYLELKKYHFENRKALLEAVIQRKKELKIKDEKRKAEDDWLIKNKIGPLEATENNCARYFSVKPCKRGHVGLRFVANRRCLICCSIAGKEEKKIKARHMKERIAGFETITIHIHPLDKLRVLKYVEALSTARLIQLDEVH